MYDEWPGGMNGNTVRCGGKCHGFVSDCVFEQKRSVQASILDLELDHMPPGPHDEMKVCRIGAPMTMKGLYNQTSK